MKHYWIVWMLLGLSTGLILLSLTRTLEETTVEPVPQQSPDLAIFQQKELDEYTAQIEQQKAMLYSYQKASYEALQELEVLQSRVQVLKQVEQTLVSKKRKK